MSGRFTDDETYPRMIAQVFVSVGLSGVWVHLGELWASTILMIRVENPMSGVGQFGCRGGTIRGDFRRGSHLAVFGRVQQRAA
jgi:hypothetical protein